MRRLLRRRLAGRVLFVCHGNMCRSPYAAATFSQRMGASSRSNVRVDSAGFVAPGRPAPRHAIEVAARRGIDLSEHRSKLVAPGNWAGVELVLVMEPRQRDILEALYGRDGREILILGDFDPQAGAARAIADPIGQPQAAFEDSYARIDRCVDALVTALSAAPPIPAAPSP